MHADDRNMVREVLGKLFKGHADKAMAFIWKAANSTAMGGTFASVLPSPLLESNAGERWRKAVMELANMVLVGRFRGYSFFQNAMVEPAFVVMQRKISEDDLPRPVHVLLSDEGAEDESLRAIRRNRPDGEHADDDSFSVFTAPPSIITSVSWMPRSKKMMELIRRLKDSEIATVGELFSIDQGVLTGLNSAFILSKAEFLGLPEDEREYFMPAIGSSTIRGGQILEEEYVFYPYLKPEDNDPNPKTRITTVDELRKMVPNYFDGWLQPFEDRLLKREGFGQNNWWLLTRERRWPKVPKIVTAYFGETGSFSFDVEGRFVVVQGYIWRWNSAQDNGDEEAEEIDFNRSGLPWAYVAMLNSSVFETMLSQYCPRVQGGQFNLSDRFVSNAFLPDLTDESRVVPDDVKELSHWIEFIHESLS